MYNDRTWPYFLTVMIIGGILVFFFLAFTAGENQGKRHHEREMACIQSGRSYVRGHDGFNCMKMGQ